MLAALAAGWRYAADLGDQHGEWSTLMWWCCGSYLDSEVPKMERTDDRRL
jgi:hypothetical protein